MRELSVFKKMEVTSLENKQQQPNNHHMSRSRKKVAVKDCSTGYATSDETFDKSERKVARKSYRRKLKTTTSKFVTEASGNMMDCLEHIVDKKPEKWEGCRICADRCKTAASFIRYWFITEKDQEDLDRFEKTNKIAVLRRYRHAKHK